jgi:hypothetical protein
MARWNEEQDRWMGRGDRYGEDERRFRAERGEEGGWQGRDWREDDRFGEGWRAGERDEPGARGGGWGERRTERYSAPRGEYGRDWERAYGRDRELGRSGGLGSSAHGERDRLGERWRGEGWRGEGAYDEERVGAGYGGSRGGSRGGYGGSYGAGPSGSRGEYSTYGSGADVGGWRTEEHRRDSGRPMRYGREGHGSEREMERWGRERERGAFDRMGDRIKEGVRKLTGRGPKGYRRPDERIRDDVSERIARSGIDAENVEVKVENGEVTLSGFVSRREDKRELEDLAEDVFGVVEVHDHLRVSRGEATGAAATAGTGTTGTGTTMSAQQRGARTPSTDDPSRPPGRH